MFYTYKDISLYYEVQGTNKKTLVILPGWGETRNTFDYMIEYLSNFFTVYIIDYPGFGNSPIPKKNLTIFDYSDLVYQWMKELNLKDPVLIGHSFGGRIITVLNGYYNYPFSNIIYMDSAGIKPKKSLYALFRSYSYKLLKKLKCFIPKKHRQSYMKKIFSIYASPDYKNLNQNMRETFKNIVNYDLKHYLKNIKSKVLIIWGNNDIETPLNDARIMLKYIKDSELVIIDKVGHFPYLERPDLINSILYEQLKEEIT